MNYVIGNLLQLAEQGNFDVIVHGCNCFNTMGGGIAAAISSSYPNVYKADCNTISGNRSKLGTYTSDVVNKNHSFIVVNAYTQYTCWDVNDMLSYEAIDEVFYKIAHDFKGKRIGIPLIGAGLARGDWSKIVRIIEKHIKDNITVVVFDRSTFQKVVLPSFDLEMDAVDEV